jgi:hypothetical protein
MTRRGREKRRGKAGSKGGDKDLTSTAAAHSPLLGFLTLVRGRRYSPPVP